jgi:hypothetical protein
MVRSLKRALSPFFLFSLFSLFSPALLFAKVELVLVNDGVMPPKEVKKIEQMGNELYEKTNVPVFVAVVGDLNRSKPIDLINEIKKNYSTYILLFMSVKPTSVNIFASDDAKRLIDIDQILSPLPWRGTIRPVMSPAFSKNANVKQEVAIFNGYADIVDQVAESKQIKLLSSIGSESRTSFQFVRTIFYLILLFVIFKFISKRKKNARR